MGGRGSSSGGSAGNAVKGIARLQGAVANARTDMLVSAYSTLSRKNLQQMTSEEKMVRAVTIDELSNRGRMVYDAKTGEYSLSSAKNIVNTESRSYRVHSIEKISLGADTKVTVATADYLYGGKWHEVKNVETQKEIAELYRRRRKR